MAKINEADVPLVATIQLSRKEIETFYRIVQQVGAESGSIRGRSEGKAYLDSLNKIPYLEKQKQHARTVEDLWKRLLHAREAREKRAADNYVEWWGRAVSNREAKERLSQQRREQREEQSNQRAASSYSKWYDKAMFLRELANRRSAERSATNEKKAADNYVLWWQRALINRDRHEAAAAITRKAREDRENRRREKEAIASAKREAAERAKANIAFARPLPIIPQSVTPPTQGGSGTNFLNFSWGLLGKIYASILAIRVAWYSIRWVTSGMMSLVKWGLEFNQTMQASQYGLAGLITSTATLVDAQGKLVPAADKWNAALSVSKRLVDDLVKASYTKTLAPVDMLLRGAQEGMGPMLGAGMGDKDIIPFITRVAQVMQALQIPLREIGQEIRSLLGGDANPRTARLGAWFKGNFFTEENYTKSIANLKATGKFLEEFMSKTVDVGKAGEVLFNTLAGSWARLKNMAQAAMGNETSKLYVSLKHNIDAITNALIRFDKDGKPVFNDALVAVITKITDAISGLATATVKAAEFFTGTGGLVDTLQDFKDRFSKDPIIVTIKTIWNETIGRKTDPNWGLTEDQIKNLTPQQRRKLDAINGKSETKPLETFTEMMSYLTGRNTEWTNGRSAKGDLIGLVTGPVPNLSSDKSYVQQQSRVQKAEAQVKQLVKLLGFSFNDKYGFKGKVVGDVEEKLTADQLKAQEHSVRQLILSNKERLEKSSDISEAQRLENKLTTTAYRIELERLNVLEQISKLSDEAIRKASGMDRNSFVALINQGLNTEKSANTGTIYNEHFSDLLSKATTFADIYSKMLKDQEKIDKEFEKTLSGGKSIQDLYKPYYKALEEDEKRLRKQNARDTKRTFMLEEMKAKTYTDAVESRTKIFMRTMSEGLINMSQGFVTGGIKGLLREASNNFGLLVGDSVQNLINRFNFRGIEEVYNDENMVVGYKNPGSGEVWNSREEAAANRKGANRAMMGMQYAQIGLGAYANARANYDGAIGSGVLNGAIGGFGVGGGVGAVVGAIIGGISSAYAKQQARDEYKFGRFGIDEKGNAFGYNGRNLNPQEVASMIAETQATFDEFYSSYVELVMKLPNFVLPTVKKINADFQKEASKNYLKHWDEWIAGTLPDTIANQFRDGMEDAAVSMGMSVEKFNEMWTKLDKLDPKKTVELWSIAFDAMEKIQESMSFFGYAAPQGRRRSVGASASDSQAVKWDTVRSEMNMSVPDSLRKADEQIYNLGQKMEVLTGEARIRAAQELGNLMVERMEKEKEYMRQLISLADEIHKQVAATIDEWTAEGLKNADGSPDYQKQAEFWKEKGDKYLQDIRSAATPEQAREAWDNYYAAINKVKELWSQLGPNNSEHIREWAIDALKRGQVIFDEAVLKMGNSLSTLNDEFRAKIEPYLDTFFKVLEDAGGAFDQITDPIRELPEDIDRTREKFKDLNTTLDSVSASLGAFGAALTGGRTSSFATAAVERRY